MNSYRVAARILKSFIFKGKGPIKSKGFSKYYDVTEDHDPKTVGKLWRRGHKPYDPKEGQTHHNEVDVEKLWRLRHRDNAGVSSGHSEEGYKKIKNSLQERGYDVKIGGPLHVGVDRRGTAVVQNGNHRLKAAREVGIKRLPVVYHTHENDIKGINLRNPLPNNPRKRNR